MEVSSALAAFETGDFGAIRDALMLLLQEGAASRHSPLHTLTLASAGADGKPYARTVVLRGFDEVRCQVRLHTDSRSPKCEELRLQPAVTMLWYAADWKLQIRIEARIQVHNCDALARRFWKQMAPHSRRIYLAPLAPGTVSEQPVTDVAPHFVKAHATEENTAAGFEVFTVLLAVFEEIEWLTLSSGGNRRGRIRLQDGEWHGVWLAP